MTEQKKNKPHFIIPATFFRKLKGSPTIAINEVQNVLPEKLSKTEEVLVNTEENSKEIFPVPE